MTLFRPHRRYLYEAMREVIEVNSLADLAKHLMKTREPLGVVKVEKYGGIDERIGWDTYIVTINGDACGFTNGPLE